FVLNMHKSNQSFEYELYLKAGVDHLYVIHDILDVTNHLLEGNEYTFGKQLKYTPKEYFLFSEDRKLLTYINEIGKAQEEIFQMLYVGHSLERNGVLSIDRKSVV